MRNLFKPNVKEDESNKDISLDSSLIWSKLSIQGPTLIGYPLSHKLLQNQLERFSRFWYKDIGLSHLFCFLNTSDSISYHPTTLTFKCTFAGQNTLQSLPLQHTQNGCPLLILDTDFISQYNITPIPYLSEQKHSINHHIYNQCKHQQQSNIKDITQLQLSLKHNNYPLQLFSQSVFAIAWHTPYQKDDGFLPPIHKRTWLNTNNHWIQSLAQTFQTTPTEIVHILKDKLYIQGPNIPYSHDTQSIIYEYNKKTKCIHSNKPYDINTIYKVLDIGILYTDFPKQPTQSINESHPIYKRTHPIYK